LTLDLQGRIERVENGLEVVTDDKAISKPEPQNLYERMKHLKVPGIAIAVVNDNAVEWTKGYGRLDVDRDSLAMPDSIFHACSMSKFVTAMTVLKLVHEGAVALDEPINRKLTGWEIPDNAFTREKPATLRHLLSHQAGIIDQDTSFDVHQADDPLPDLLDILQGNSKYNPKPVEIECLPESRFIYSDAGFCVIEQLLTDVTRKPFGKLVKEVLFDPLEMSNICFQHPFEFDDTTHVAVGHDRHGAVVDGKRATYPYLAAAGLWSTATDLSLLVIELQQSLKGAGKLQISTDLVQDMLTSQGCAPWAGLGVFLRGEGTQMRMSSLGWGVGFQCMLATYPYLRGGGVVMTNSDPGYPQEKALTGELVTSVEREYAWPETRQ
jgi:CubicO group peptidase (beta-lactamase class C family)